ncbi:hypothetical protein DO97_20095 [Neosynechococcus sphagnicola sy1]|uniref:Sigma-70 family RNA polymerase sigma factor n=1 Tax=Neosynechococcus sphagnicola sy1 TaxID=1497020 RepID=A0A098TM54_9CYAN|nr:hypothetical protein DO97_20095 [Neosynechococcus sphagnicola sy1]
MLNRLVIKTCQSPPNSLERRQGLTQMIRLISQSGRLWHHSSPYYEDALQQTWLYLCRNLCESTTGPCFDPERGKLLRWLNAYLRWRISDFYNQASQDHSSEPTPRPLDNFESANPIETLAAAPDLPPMIEITQDWVEEDPQQELQIHLDHHPTITCQFLILHRLPPATTWRQLSEDLGVPMSTLSSFYQRQCLPRLRKFGENHRYIQ